MSETTEEATNEPNRTLNNKEWNKLLQTLNKIAKNEKEKKNIWKAGNLVNIASLIVSSLHLILTIVQITKG